MSRSLLPALAFALVGCPAEEPVECTTYDEVFVWVDADGDGFGSDQPIGYVCVPGANEATNKVDCDDENPDVNPGMDEQCDLLDNDCNGLVDETWPKIPWYPDADGDGFGSPDASESACQPPGPNYIEIAGDCDDTNPAINPTAIEICDTVDNDCDTLVDDSDPGVDPSTYSRWHADFDGDGFGDRENFLELCAGPPAAVLDGQDCDDDDDTINPDANEVCDEIDNDCDDLVDDFDKDIDPSTQLTFYADTDGDGYGDASVPTFACRPTPGIGVDNDDDCDDSDPLANVRQDWLLDVDGDGAGVGAPVVTQCLNPGPGLAPASNGVDCDDSDPTRAPQLADPCGDGIDQNCDTFDTCTSCQVWQDADPFAVDGVYSVEPVPGNRVDVWCDMTTDGGGWTLVGSTALTTFDDAGTGAYYGDLRTLNPSGGHSQVWNGMRSVVQTGGDIRFACKTNPNDGAMTVDLSFYDVDWYAEITSGSDAASCFHPVGSPPPPPERRNNLTGAILPFGDVWNGGGLVGEDSCSDSGDFTVDFDDRGMDSNQSDGTDWGEDDSSKKCGVNGIPGGAWFIFVRE